MKFTSICLAVLAITGSIASAEAQTRTASIDRSRQAVAAPFLTIFGETAPPRGWVQFCRDEPRDCVDQDVRPRDAEMTRERWRDLIAINTRVNRDVVSITDQDHYGVAEYWAYPRNGKGDCEDYVLEKRRQLIARGFPESSLLITVVRDSAGDGHAVLTVRTTEGDFVLDNVRDDIRAWHQTGYSFIRRQSQINRSVWVALTPSALPSQMPVAATR